jgi:hypothetical protein
LPRLSSREPAIFHLSTWPELSSDEIVKSWTEKTTEEMCEMARQEGKLSKFIYPNDADEKQNVFAGYEEGCVERLRDVSRKYDPERAIQRLQGSGGNVGM